MLFGYIADICQALDIQFVDYPDWLWGKGHDLTQTCYAPINADDIYNLNIVYIGNRESISGLSTAMHKSSRVFTMIRDPRDCLVSMYFSFLGSHAAPACLTSAEIKKWETQKRRAMREMAIDDYVLQQASNYNSNLTKILDFTGHAGTATIIRYEDFIFNKLGLCNKIVDQIYSSTSERVDTSSLELDVIAENRNVVPRKERPERHTRRVIPGDHNGKLKPMTIDQLNSLFAEVLVRYGYLA